MTIRGKNLLWDVCKTYLNENEPKTEGLGIVWKSHNEIPFVSFFHKIHSQPCDTLSSTHIIIAPFVVLVLGLYVDGKLGQEGALGGRDTKGE